MIELDYEPAPVEVSLAAAREMLARLYEFPLPVIGEGACHDCRHEQALLKYGQVEICRPCAHSRNRARLKLEVAA